MPVELNIEDPRWERAGLEGLADRACDATLRHAGLDPELCEIDLLACDDARIARLNAEFRGKPTATNVLSWPAAELRARDPGGEPGPPQPDFTGAIALGDIAIAWDTCSAEAEAAAKPLAEHITHLLVHGILHLLGYDHERDADATLMQKREVEILGKMGIGDPYCSVDGP